MQNYKLMISSTVPRPIALVSTISKDGNMENLAPFSYFNNVCNDPPRYSIPFHGELPTDSLRNLLETKECCISIVSDWFLEAMNMSSVNTPPDISEWPLSGLHVSKSDVVRPGFVTESAFSMECRFHNILPVFSKNEVDAKGEKKRTATHILVEAVMFHVREDTIDDKMETIDIKVLRPVWRGGGITYGSCFEGWKTPRPGPFRELRETEAVQEILEKVKSAKNQSSDNKVDD
jgi:flavin reductase (DIM6/NTAB) family NADH-FMN oxidoreductase RutF